MNKESFMGIRQRPQQRSRGPIVLKSDKKKCCLSDEGVSSFFF